MHKMHKHIVALHTPYTLYDSLERLIFRKYLFLIYFTQTDNKAVSLQQVQVIRYKAVLNQRYLYGMLCIQYTYIHTYNSKDRNAESEVLTAKLFMPISASV